MSDELWRPAVDGWLTLPIEARIVFRSAGIVILTLFAARFVGWVVGRRLRAAQFDAAFRRPWSPTPTGRPDTHPPTPTRLVAGLVRATVWAGGLWVLLSLHEAADAVRQLEWGVGRIWAFALVVLAAAYLSRLLSERLVDAVNATPLKTWTDTWPNPTGKAGVGPVVGFLADALAVLFALLVAADLTGLARAGEVLAAAGRMVVYAVTAGIALLIGWAGARLVQAQARPETQAGFAAHTAASVMGGATVLAVLLLAGNFPPYLGLALLALAVMLVWPAQRYLPDVYAGLLLRAQAVKEVTTDAGTYPVAGVGLVTTQLTYPDGPKPWRNRAVLDAHLGSDPNGPGTTAA